MTRANSTTRKRFDLTIEHIGRDDRWSMDLRQAIKRLLRSYSLRVIRIVEAQDAAEGKQGGVGEIDATRDS